MATNSGAVASGRGAAYAVVVHASGSSYWPNRARAGSPLDAQRALHGCGQGSRQLGLARLFLARGRDVCAMWALLVYALDGNNGRTVSRLSLVSLASRMRRAMLCFLPSSLLVIGRPLCDAVPR